MTYEPGQRVQIKVYEIDGSPAFPTVATVIGEVEGKVRVRLESIVIVSLKGRPTQHCAKLVLDLPPEEIIEVIGE